MDFEEAKKHQPIAIYPDNNNRLISWVNNLNK
jgi:hypothetical protein